MSRFVRFSAVAFAAVLLIGPLAASAQQSVPAAPPAATVPPLPPGLDKATIERIVHDYILAHPEVLVEAITELRRRQEQATADQARKAMADQHEQIFNDPATPVGGNAKGDVTIVEFFDYHCGYCKQVQPSMESLLKEDGKLRVVYKELPILAPESRIAAAGALAAQRQGKYLAMHNALMSARGKLDKSRVLQIGKEVGLDVARLEKDMALPEIDAAIDRNLKLAGELGINGTPTFLIGDEFVPGAIDKDEIKKLIAKARKS
jgi:protein-disulfide isomerase